MAPPPALQYTASLVIAPIRLKQHSIEFKRTLEIHHEERRITFATLRIQRDGRIEASLSKQPDQPELTVVLTRAIVSAARHYRSQQVLMFCPHSVWIEALLQHAGWNVVGDDGLAVAASIADPYRESEPNILDALVHGIEWNWAPDTWEVENRRNN